MSIFKPTTLPSALQLPKDYPELADGSISLPDSSNRNLIIQPKTISRDLLFYLTNAPKGAWKSNFLPSPFWTL